MQNVGEKLTSGTAVGSIASEFLGIQLTPSEWGNAIIAVIMTAGWFFFKWQDLQLRKEKQAHELQKKPHK